MDNSILVLYVRPYDLIDERTGERKEGISVHYLDSTSNFNDSQNGYGNPIFKSSLPKESMSLFTSVPGIYSPEFATYMAKGQRCSKLSGVKLLKEVAFWNK